MKNLLGFLILSLVSLPAFAQSTEPAPIGSHPGFESFKKNVYPVIHGTAEKPGQCVKCHNTMGPGPAHSSDDPWASYHLILPYVNFQNLKYSKFVAKGVNGHGNAYGGQVTLTEEGMIDILNKWWLEGESKAFLKDKKVLMAQNLPALPSNGDYVTMSWGLGPIDASLRGLQFKIDVQRFAEAEGSHMGANRFKNPRIEGDGKTVKVQGVYFIVNGNPDTLANDFVSIDMNVQYVGMLSFLQQIVLDDKGPQNDQIAIAFQNISLAPKGEKPQVLDTLSDSAPKTPVTPAVPTSPITALTPEKSLEAFNESIMGLTAHFIKIKAAEFDMGSPSGASPNGRQEPLRHVKLTKDFDIQATDVTQIQWFLVMGQNPSGFSSIDRCDPNNYYNAGTRQLCAFHPVDSVSWPMTQDFIQKLNSLQTEYTYRLPTEAEWEYVAHGGLPVEYSYGFGPEFDSAYGWVANNSNRQTHQVASKLPIPTPSDPQEAIYDMVGNVRQWVEDCEDQRRRAGETEVDPVAIIPRCGQHVLRGGSHSAPDIDARASARYADNTLHNHADMGFRLVRGLRSANPLPQPPTAPGQPQAQASPSPTPVP